MSIVVCNPGFSMPCDPFTKITGAGAGHNYVFNFPYLDQDSYEYTPPDTLMSTFIKVFVAVTGTNNWAEVTSGIYMPDNTSVTSSVDWTGKTVLIKRNSKVCEILVPFEPGSPVVTTGTTSNVRKDSLQKAYLLQELAAAITDLDCAITAVSALAGNVYRWTANGSTYDFACNTAASLQTPTTQESGLLAGQVYVHIDGIYQQTDQFTMEDISDISTVRFVHDVDHPAPYNGAKIELQVIAGSVVPDINIADGSITCAKLANGAICSLAKFDLDDLATNKQVLCFFDSGSGVTLDIKTLTYDFISGFDTRVRTSRLSDMTVPNANVSMNTHKITNCVDPTAGSQEVATAAYVDAKITAALPGADTGKNKPGLTTLSGSTVNIINVGFDWDSVILTYDESNVVTSYTPNSGTTVSVSTGTYNTFPGSWHVLSSECASYVTCIFKREGGSLTGEGFQVQKSGNNCNFKLTNTLMTGIKIKYYFTKASA